MAEFDLSAQRAKRSPESKTLIMRDEDGAVLDKYELAPDFPADAMDAGAEGKIGMALRLLFVDPKEADHFFGKYKPSVGDLFDIMRGAYGLGDNPGEALVSGR